MGRVRKRRQEKEWKIKGRILKEVFNEERNGRSEGERMEVKQWKKEGRKEGRWEEGEIKVKRGGKVGSNKCEMIEA